MAAARGGGAGSSNNDLGRVYRAVARAGVSDQQLRAVIVDVSHGSSEVRRAAVNFPGKNRSDNNKSETPLACAHRLKRSDLVGVLLEAGAQPDPSFSGCLQNPLVFCIAHGQAESLRLLLRSSVPYDPILGFWHPRRKGGQTFTCTAAHLCLLPPSFDSPYEHSPPQLACLEALLDELGAQSCVNAPDSDGAPPLTWVAYMQGHEHEAAVDLLLRHGADPQAGFAGDRAPVVEWCYECYRGTFKPHVVECLRKLAAAGAHLTGLGDDVPPPLFLAAGANADVVRFLLEEQHVPVDERDPSTGKTALHECYGDGENVANLLLDAGADLEAADDQGRTPIFYCAQQEDAGVLEVLLARGASPDVEDYDGATPMMAACSDPELPREWCFFYGQCDTANVLLRRSSPETLRAVRETDGFSAADCILRGLLDRQDMLLEWYWEDHEPQWDDDEGHEQPDPPLHELLGDDEAAVLLSLLRASAPVAPEHTELAMPLVLEQILPGQQRAEIEMAFRRRPSNRWRGEDEIVQLAFDFVELREAEEGVRRREARVRELEEELRALGEGTEDTDEEEDDEEEDEEAEAAASGGDEGDESGGGDARAEAAAQPSSE